MRSLWANMDKGGFSPELGEDVLRFNGGLFENTEAIALNADQLEILIDAAERDWSAVEPAIFGTLLERALDERGRERLGAHYTPRAYVERLVLPTIIEPLRADWEAGQGRPQSNWPISATRRLRSPNCADFMKIFAGSRSSTRPAAPVISCMFPWSI